jgi:vacuolar-type H+-ATPase subunit H
VVFRPHFVYTAKHLHLFTVKQNMEITWSEIRFSQIRSEQRQARVQALLGQTTFEDLLAVFVWAMGGCAADSQSVWNVQRSRFYERLQETLEALGRRTPAVESQPPACPLSPALIGRVVEVVVTRPGVSAEDIAAELKAQDGTQVAAADIQAYLTHAGLATYQASAFLRDRLQVTPASKAEGVLGDYTRYAAAALNAPVLEHLGYRTAVAKLDVTGPRAVYPHQLQCDVLVWGYWYGKSRVFQTGELVVDEFALALGVGAYPKGSELQSHLDEIVQCDQDQVDARVPGYRRLIEGFTRLARKGLALAGGPGVGQVIYLDTHIVKLYSAADIDRTKNASMAHPVKAILKLRAVSAQRGGRPVLFTYEQASTAFIGLVHEAIRAVEAATGKPVKLVGADRGALSWELLDSFEGGACGYVVWAEDTPTVRQAAADLPLSDFVDAEFETVRRAEGRKTQRVKTQVANVPRMKVNADGKTYRAVVVRDVRTEHRAVLFAVGQPAHRLSATALLEFMRGKQWVEEDFKQGKRQGADAFCGGDIVPELRREPPTPAEVEQLKERTVKLKERGQANQAEEQAAQAQHQAKQISKRQLNDLLKGIQRRREQIVADQRETEDLLRWAKTGRVPDSQVRWIVDTRKMTIVSQLHDFARLAQQDTVTEIKACVLEVLIERELARQRPPISPARQSDIHEAMRQQVARLPWGQLTRRIFDQGGWVKRNPETHIMWVTLKAFDNAVIQAAMERLCARWNQKAAQMPCEDGVYTLQFACQSPPSPP